MFSSSSGYYQFRYSLLIIMYYNCEIKCQVDTMGNAHKGGHNKRNTYECGNNLKPLHISSNEEKRF